MGFFGKVRDFFFETESQLIIKCELETQREANKKLFAWNGKLQSHNELLQEKMDTVLTRLDENNKFIHARIDGLMSATSNKEIQEDLNKMSEKMGFIYDDQVTQNRRVHAKITESTEGLSNVINDVVKDHNTGMKERLSLIFDKISCESNKTNMLADSIVDAKITPLINTVEAIRSGVGDGNDKLTALQTLISGCFENVDATIAEIKNMLAGIAAGMVNHFGNMKDDLNMLLTTVGNVEEVVTNPKPFAEIKDVVDIIFRTVEQTHGYLNNEEYKQQWDMKQVTAQLVEVRQLLEMVEALFPKQSGESQKEILNLFEDIGELYLTPKNMMNLLGYSNKQVYSALAKMVKNGSIVLLNRGQYTTPSKLEEYNERQKSDADKSINSIG